MSGDSSTTARKRPFRGPSAGLVKLIAAVLGIAAAAFGVLESSTFNGSGSIQSLSGAGNQNGGGTQYNGPVNQAPKPLDPRASQEADRARQELAVRIDACKRVASAFPALSGSVAVLRGDIVTSGGQETEIPRSVTTAYQPDRQIVVRAQMAAGNALNSLLAAEVPLSADAQGDVQDLPGKFTELLEIVNRIPDEVSDHSVPGDTATPHLDLGALDDRSSYFTEAGSRLVSNCNLTGK